jgi:hypothetical protein
MENITMTNATQILRAVSGCPQVAVGHLAAGSRVRVQGIAVSMLGSGFGVDRSMVVAPAPAFYAPLHKSVQDVAHLRHGGPPV